MEDDVLHQHNQGSQDERSKQVHVDVVACAVEFSVQGENQVPFLRKEWLGPISMCLKPLCIYHWRAEVHNVGFRAERLGSVILLLCASFFYL